MENRPCFYKLTETWKTIRKNKKNKPEKSIKELLHIVLHGKSMVIEELGSPMHLSTASPREGTPG